MDKFLSRALIALAFFVICAYGETDIATVFSNSFGPVVCLVKGNSNESMVQWKYKSKHDDLLSITTINVWPPPVTASGANNFTAVKMHGWKITSSNESEGVDWGPIMDTRWNNLSSVNVNKSATHTIPVKSKNGVFHEYFSIAARQPIMISLLSEQHKYQLKVALNATFHDSNVALGTSNILCAQKKDDKQGKCELIKGDILQLQYDIIHGKGWSHIGIHLDKGTISLTKDKEVVLKGQMHNGDSTISNISFNMETPIAYYYVKHHAGKILVPPDKHSTLSMPVQLDKGQKVCFSIIYFNDKGVMKLRVLKGKDTIHRIDLNSQKGRWQVKRVFLDSAIAPGEITLEIGGVAEKNVNRAIASIRTCRENEYHRIMLNKSPSINKIECSVDNRASWYQRFSNTKDISLNKFGDEFLQAWSLNLNEINDKMNAQRVCNPVECHCWKGFNNNDCARVCSTPEYGFNCAEKCDNCINQECDRFSGKCNSTTSCSDNYRPPFCQKKLLAAKMLPVKAFGISWVEVDVGKATEEFNGSFIDYLTLAATCSVNCVNSTLKLPWPLKQKQNIVRLDGLNSQTTYQLQLHIHEKNVVGSVYNTKGEVAAFTTNGSCSPNYVVNVEYASNTHLKLKWKDGSNSCPPEDYFVTINRNQERGKRLIKGYWKQGKLFSISATFNSKNQMGSISMTKNQLTWTKPILENIVNGYTVRLKHVEFLACKGIATNNKVADNLTKTTDLKVEFENLKPFSIYGASVSASSIDGGEILCYYYQFNTSATATIQSPPRIDEENSTISHSLIALRWLPPDCSLAGCIPSQQYSYKFENASYTNSTKRVFINTSVLRGRAYKIQIRSRCENSTEWTENGTLYFDIKPNFLNGWEIAGIASALILIIACIICSIIFCVWRNRRTKSDPKTKEGENLMNDTELQVRYHPPPRRLGELVKKANIVDYVDRVKQSGQMRKDFEMLPRGQQKPWTVGMSSSNKHKNRYANIAAYDCNRVCLGATQDYINASFIENEKGVKVYIAAQGPTKTTAADFWQMVMQENVSTIVMVTKLVEGREQCYKYWPDLMGGINYNELIVENVREDDLGDHIERRLKMRDSRCSREVQQLHYRAWPSRGVPSDLERVNQFITKVQQRQHQLPLLVHCSGGTGRTGTVILVDQCIHILAKEKVVNVWATLELLRQQRVNMVDTKEQYQLAHDILAQRFSKDKK